MIERIGLVNFLDGIGVDVDPNMVADPTTSSYVRMDGWDDEAENGLRINYSLQVKHNKTITLKEKKMSEQAQQENRPPIESGCPDAFQYMHPVMRKNYGQWAYHEDPRPGVLKRCSQWRCYLDCKSWNTKDT